MEYIYAALLLHKLGKHVDSEHLHKVIASAGLEPNESKIKSLITSLKGVDIDKELESAALVSATPAASVSAEQKKEEKPKEEKKAAAAEGLSALFG